MLDGTGNPWHRADIALRGDEIAFIGDCSGIQGDEELDCQGLTICPGFIDTHSHSDLMLFKEPLAQEKVMQGVTTELLGQDGIAVAPVRPEHRDDWRRHLSGLLGDPGFSWDWTNCGEYFQRLQEVRPSINALSLAPHGSLRMWVMGMADRRPTVTELKQMTALLEEQMEAGCVGLSTGLIYPPCIYADQEELTALCSAIKKYDGFLVVHMRSEGYHIEEALNEVISVASGAGVPLHLSHLKVAGRENFGKSDRLLEMIDEARDKGLDLTFDQYPYLAGCTMLHAVLPAWTFKGGTEKLLEHLQDPSDRAKIKERLSPDSGKGENFVKLAGWEGVVISGVQTEKNRHLEGKSLAEIARLMEKDPADAALDLLVEEDLAVSMIIHLMEEADLRRIMRHPAQMACTDGIRGGKPHPRLYGTYPRILGHYARDENVLSLPEAVRKATSMPAQRLGLKDRGLIKEGFKADIVVFDHERIKDLATYEDPKQYPQGIAHVIVNGAITVSNGKHLGTQAGNVLLR